MVQSPLKNLDILQARNTDTISDLLDQVARSFALSESEEGIDEISWELAEVIQDTQSLGDMLGRRRTFLEMDAMGATDSEKSMSASRIAHHRSIGNMVKVSIFDYDAKVDKRIIRAETPINQNVSFQEAIDSLVSREPRLASGAEEVKLAYTQEKAFTFARANSIEVVKRVRQDIIRSLQGGLGRPEAVDLIAKTTGQNRAYADTIYRTNVNTAFSAGRMRQASDPTVRALIGGFRFMATKDPDVRHNHLAADGLTAGQDDPIWRILTPPLGYNCRCTIRMVSWDRLESMGLVDDSGAVRRATIPAGAFPDQGFRPTRPDKIAYAGVPQIPITST